MTREEVVNTLRRCANGAEFDQGNMCREQRCDLFSYHMPMCNCLNCINALITEAADMLEQDAPGWISVKDKLPPTKGYYLVCTYTAFYHTQCISKVFFDGKLWGSVRKRYTNITHWMPLPEPPKEEAK